MGSGIAQTFAFHGFRVTLFDPQPAALATAKTRIAESLARIAKNEPSPAAIMDRILVTDRIEDCVADLVIEAVVEDLEVKIQLLNQVAALNGSETIYATNTSSLAVTDIAGRFSHPARLAGMHFFNPAAVMKLVEVVMTPFTGPKITDSIVQICRSVGKTPVRCTDTPGFIVNRVARPFYLEALYVSETGNAPIELIDSLMEASGFRMGPFRLMDLIGNDVNFAVSTIVYEALGKPGRLRPSPTQQAKVQAGALGKKTGHGFYDYPRQ